MSRAQFQGAMAEHARDLIAEMEDQRQNPVEAFMDYIRNRRIASKLAKKHGEANVREVFTALAEVPDFAPASLLWNAGHRHVPLYCFIRDRKAPEFRVRDMKVERDGVGIDVEYGDRCSRRLTREVFLLRRGWHGNLFVEERRQMRR